MSCLAFTTLAGCATNQLDPGPVDKSDTPMILDSINWTEPFKLPFEGDSYEPAVKVAPSGMMVAHAHKGGAANEGTQLASHILWSRDGAQWAPMPGMERELYHGWEGDVAFDDAGKMYFFDLGDVGGSITSWNVEGPEPVFIEFLPLGLGTSAQPDRPWLMAYGNGQLLLLSNDVVGVDEEAEPNRFWLRHSSDGGLTWTVRSYIPDSWWCHGTLDREDSNHVLVGCYVPFPPSTSAPYSYVSYESFDGGFSWVPDSIQPLQYTNGHQFPFAALNQGDPVHAFIDGRSNEADNHYFVASKDTHGWRVSELFQDAERVQRPSLVIANGTVLAFASVQNYEDHEGWRPVVAEERNGSWPVEVLHDVNQAPAGEAGAGSDFWHGDVTPQGDIVVCWGVKTGATVSQSPGLDYLGDSFCSIGRIR